MTRHVTVGGGGISGLATVYALTRMAAEGAPPITCAPSLKRCHPSAGRLTHQQDEFVVEGGPDPFLAQKPEILAGWRNWSMRSPRTSYAYEPGAVPLAHALRERVGAQR